MTSTKEPYIHIHVTLLTLLGFILIVLFPSQVFATFNEPTYGPIETYSGGAYIISTTTGDIDGDGDLDLVTARLFANNVFISLNDGNGNFTEAASYATGVWPYQVTLGDMNNDGSLDIVTANQENTPGDNVSILLNQGDGTFAAYHDYGTASTSRSVALADFDNDGDLDVATGNIMPFGQESVTTYLNDGSGVLSSETYYARPQAGYVTAADVNDDGFPELAVTNGSDLSASIFFNTGNGQFGTEDVYTLGTAAVEPELHDVHTSSFADLDGDGDLDWVIGNRNINKLTFLYNNGDGIFGQRMDCGTILPQFVYIRDFNKDGIADVMTLNHHASIYNSVSILLGLSDGTYTNSLVVPMGQAAVEAAVGDFNGDTNLDIATADYFGDSLSRKLMTGLAPSNLDTTSNNCEFSPLITELSLRITTNSPLPSGTLGVPYSTLLAAAGGTPPYTWSIAEGTLPTGLQLNQTTGEISGTPTTAGTFGFTIQVADSAANTATKPFAVDGPPPSGTAGSGYTVPVNIDPDAGSGGSEPSTCANYIVVAGELPAGLNLDAATGIVTGTPTNGGEYTFTIGCTVSGGQNNGQTATKVFTITIYNPAPTITSLDPNATTAGGGPFVLTVNGTNFVTSSTVQWNGAGRTTAYVSATQLHVAIQATDIANVGSANIIVVNPEPGGGTSGPATFTITPATQPPIANFSWSPEMQAEGIPVQFTDLSVSDSGMIQSWHWNFGGLGTSSDQHPTFTFPDNGLYNICLTVTDPPNNGAPNYTIIEFERNAPFPGDNSTPWPRGDVTLGGVPFRIPVLDPSVWKSEDPFMTGPNPRTLDILVNQQGVDRVYTLINTGGGALGPTAYAWLEFWGDGGAYHRKDLVGNVDLRDYNYDGWTNQINGTTTVNVFLHNPGVYNGERRLDMQIIDLPAAFLLQTLTHIRLSDNGGDNLQRTILEGVAAEVLTMGNNTDTICQDITINNVAPTANAGGDQTIFRNAPVTLSGTWSDPAGALDNPYTWSWDLNGDGVIDDSGSASDGDTIARTTSFMVDGTAILTFSVTDKDGATSSDTVQITVVNRAPMANEQTVNTAEDIALPITLTGSDTDNDPLTFSVLSMPSYGDLTGAAPNLTYTPDPDFFSPSGHPDSFTFKVNDGLADSNVATINITVNPVNDPAVALDDTAPTAEDTPVIVTVQGNDSAGPSNEDPTLTTTAVTDPPDGTAVINPDGSVTYTPDPDFSETDSFGYTVCDSEGACATATVTVFVDQMNDLPLANDDSVTTLEDTPITINVVANDSDVDGNLNPSSVTVVSGPAHGTLLHNGNGNFTYTPDANFNTADSFSYEICDGAGACDTADVFITVTAVNDAPICSGVAPSVSVLWPPNHQFEPVSITGVTDEEGNPITIAITAIFQDEPTNGTGDGDTAPDGQGSGSSTAQVRAERKGNGNGRYYHISFAASDGNGGACAGTVKVSVPKNMGNKGAAVDDGPLYNSTQP